MIIKIIIFIIIIMMARQGNSLPNDNHMLSEVLINPLLKGSTLLVKTHACSPN